MSGSVLQAPGGASPPREAGAEAALRQEEMVARIAADLPRVSSEDAAAMADVMLAAARDGNVTQTKDVAFRLLGDGVAYEEGSEVAERWTAVAHELVGNPRWGVEARERLEVEAKASGHSSYAEVAILQAMKAAPQSHTRQRPPALVAFVSRRPERRSSRKAARKAAGTRRRSSSSGVSSGGGDSDQPGDPSPSAEQPQLPDGTQEHRSGNAPVSPRSAASARILRRPAIDVNRVPSGTYALARDGLGYPQSWPVVRVGTAGTHVVDSHRVVPLEDAVLSIGGDPSAEVLLGSRRQVVEGMLDVYDERERYAWSLPPAVTREGVES